MFRKTVSVTMLTLLLTGMFFSSINIKPAKAWTGTVYIRADGSIDPPNAPITTYDNITYTLTDNITSSGDGLVIMRDNIIIDGNGYSVQGTRVDPYAGIRLNGTSNVTIMNMEIINFWIGIYLSWSSNNSVIKNEMLNNYYGICLNHSLYNSIIENDVICVRSDILIGIFLDESYYNLIHGNHIVTILGHPSLWNGIYLNGSSYNIVNENYIAYNNHGIWLSYSSNNTISGNEIKSNDRYGIMLFHSLNNVIYHNNFINNTWQASSSDSTNIWDYGCPSGGNYWSDYTGVDWFSGPYQNETGSDGIGDTPYVIDENNTDRYPLMNPWMPITLPGDLNHDGTINILDIVLVASIYGCSEGEPNWNPDADLAAPYGKIDIIDLVTIAANYGRTYS